MNTPPGLLAVEIVPGSGVEPQFKLTTGLRDGLIIVGVVLVLTALLLTWAMVIRKPRRRHGSRRPPEPEPNLVRYRHERHEDQGLLSLLKPKHRRRKRRFHHRNPTLAETGGLPPPRTDQPPAVHPPTQL